GSSIGHDYWLSGGTQHLEIVEVIADRHYGAPMNPAPPGQPVEGRALRASGRKNVEDGQVASRGFRPVHLDLPRNLAGREPQLRPLHLRDGTADHPLDRSVAPVKGPLQRPNLLDPLPV